MKMRNILLITGTVLALLLLAYPFFSSNAQKNERSSKTLLQSSALEAIGRNAAANSFYDKMQQGETSKNYNWSLSKAFYSPSRSPGKKDGKETTTMFLKEEPVKVQVSITEYYSATDARFPLTLMTEQGIAKACKGDLCGDEEQKSYGNSGFISLQFKKDNYFVYITCDSEETAMRFAGYALKAITER